MLMVKEAAGLAVAMGLLVVAGLEDSLDNLVEMAVYMEGAGEGLKMIQTGVGVMVQMVLLPYSIK